MVQPSGDILFDLFSACFTVFENRMGRLLERNAKRWHLDTQGRPSFSIAVQEQKGIA
jgi:hypothetical protein